MKKRLCWTAMIRHAEKTRSSNNHSTWSVYLRGLELTEAMETSRLRRCACNVNVAGSVLDGSYRRTVDFLRGSHYDGALERDTGPAVGPGGLPLQLVNCKSLQIQSICFFPCSLPCSFVRFWLRAVWAEWSASHPVGCKDFSPTWRTTATATNYKELSVTKSQTHKWVCHQPRVLLTVGLWKSTGSFITMRAVGSRWAWSSSWPRSRNARSDQFHAFVKTRGVNSENWCFVRF